MPISKDLEKLRELFLLDLDVQARIKSAPSPSQVMERTLEEAKKRGLQVTQTELEDVIIAYAKTGANPEPACPPPPPPPAPTSIPFPALDDLPPKASKKEIAYAAINVIRDTQVGICSW